MKEMIIFHFLAHPRKKEKKSKQRTRKPRIFSRSIDRGREYEEEGTCSRKVELKLIPSLFSKRNALSNYRYSPLSTYPIVSSTKSKQRKHTKVNPPIYPPSQFIDLIVHKPLGVTDVARSA